KGSRHMEQEDGARVSIAYLRFAEDEVRDKSPLYCELLRGAASDPEVIGFLLTLAREKRQPNLFLAATRHLFGSPSPLASPRLPQWVTSSGLIMSRFGQVSLTKPTYRRIVLRCCSVPQA